MKELIGYGLAALLLMAGAQSAQAMCSDDPCAPAEASKDCDQDGYNDYEECVSGVLTFPSCEVNNMVPCVDPTKRTLFVVWDKASPSAYDTLGLSDQEVWAPFTLPTEQGGLNTQIMLLPPGSSRMVTTDQLAVLVLEDPTDPGSCPVTDSLGITDTNSNPNDLVNAVTVFSGRITRYVDCVYDSAGDTTTDRDPDKQQQLIRTSIHEVGHHTELSDEESRRFNGFHLRAGTGCGMDQTSVTSVKKGVVKISSPTTFCAPNQNAHSLGHNAEGFATHCGPSSISADCLPAE